MADHLSEAEIIKQAYSDEAAKFWRAPVQGYPPGIPWSLHLEAYEAYCAKWSKQTAMIDLLGRGCRGGFSVGELNGFVPGWRDRASYIGQLEARVAELERIGATMASDYQTSEHHHPDHVLVPIAAFEAMQQILKPSSENALGAVRKALAGIKVIGEPTVNTITNTEENGDRRG